MHYSYEYIAERYLLCIAVLLYRNKEQKIILVTQFPALSCSLTACYSELALFTMGSIPRAASDWF